MKGIKIGKWKVKLSLLVFDMIIYIGNPKDSTTNLIELINNFSNISEYKVSIQN
jgi:hypothetical protein